MNKKTITNSIKIYFQKSGPKYFSSNKVKKLNEFSSTSIIVNAANEILVDQFLKKYLLFKHFENHYSILRDRNYKKYAIRKPKNIKEIRDR